MTSYNFLKNLIKQQMISHRFFDFLFGLVSKNILRSQRIDPIRAKEQIESIKYNTYLHKYKNILSSYATVANKNHEINSPTFYNYDTKSVKELGDRFHETRIFQGLPEVIEFENVLYMPYYSCLYSVDGTRINESCLYRGCGDNLKNFSKAPDQITPPKNLTKINIDFVYGGEINNHYGHFLTESIARLWYAIKNEQYPII